LQIAHQCFRIVSWGCLMPAKIATFLAGETPLLTLVALRRPWSESPIARGWPSWQRLAAINQGTVRMEWLVHHRKALR
jgi:hypothetical protein